MKFNIDKPDHCSAIAKYLAGEMTSSEANGFEAIVNSHPENAMLVNDFRNDWKQIGNTQMNTPNVDNAWHKLITKLDEESLVEKSSIKSIGYGKPWLRVVAAVAIVLVVGSAFLFTGLLNRSIVIQSTSEPSTLVHTLADGSVVYLEPNTTLTYTKAFGKRNRDVSLDGEAFFDVSRNPELPFVIETSTAQVKVLGTSFSVKSTKDSGFEVLVQTGSVNVESKAAKTKGLIALAGDRVTLANNQLTKTRELTPPQLKHKIQRLQFKDEQLATIVQVLNKTYDANIVVESYEVGSRRLTVTFVDNSVESIVEVICAALGLESNFENSTIILRQP
jgi:ferric-dicitrate binding protein FerR (iron transport regulator)